MNMLWLEGFLLSLIPLALVAGDAGTLNLPSPGHRSASLTKSSHDTKSTRSLPVAEPAIHEAAILRHPDRVEELSSRRLSRRVASRASTESHSPSSSPGTYSLSAAIGQRAHESHPPVAFEYEVRNVETDTHFGHSEVREDDKAEGRYFVKLPDSRVQTVSYVANDDGYLATVDYDGQGELHQGAQVPHSDKFIRPGQSEGYDIHNIHIGRQKALLDNPISRGHPQRTADAHEAPQPQRINTKHLSESPVVSPLSSGRQRYSQHTSERLLHRPRHRFHSKSLESQRSHGPSRPTHTASAVNSISEINPYQSGLRDIALFVKSPHVTGVTADLHRPLKVHGPAAPEIVTSRGRIVTRGRTGKALDSKPSAAASSLQAVSRIRGQLNYSVNPSTPDLKSLNAAVETTSILRQSLQSTTESSDTSPENVDDVIDPDVLNFDVTKTLFRPRNIMLDQPFFRPSPTVVESQESSEEILGDDSIESLSRTLEPFIQEAQ